VAMAGKAIVDKLVCMFFCFWCIGGTSLLKTHSNFVSMPLFLPLCILLELGFAAVVLTVVAVVLFGMFS